MNTIGKWEMNCDSGAKDSTAGGGLDSRVLWILCRMVRRSRLVANVSIKSIQIKKAIKKSIT